LTEVNFFELFEHDILEYQSQAEKNAQRSQMIAFWVIQVTNLITTKKCHLRNKASCQKAIVGGFQRKNAPEIPTNKNPVNWRLHQGM